MKMALFFLVAALPSLAFAGSGFIRLNYLGRSPVVKQVQVLPDGATVAGGSLFWKDERGMGRVTTFVVRLTPTGAVDRSFGKDGWIVEPHLYEKMVVGDDGRILVSGAYDLPGTGGSAFWVARYLPTGKPDLSFGVAGEVVKDFGPGEESPEGLLVDPGGKITLVGLSDRGPWGPKRDEYLTMLRLLPDGKLDTSFGEGGALFRKVSLVDVQLKEVFSRPNGGWLLFCEREAWRGEGVGTDGTYILTALNSDGQVDTAYGKLGSLPFPLAKKGIQTDVLQQGDGSLVFSGFYRDVAMEKTPGWILKLNSEGALDPKFGVKGLVNLGHYVSGLAPDKEGGYWFTASQDEAVGQGLAVGRLNATGALHKGFGRNGVIVDGVTQGKVHGQSSKLVVDASSGKITVSAKIDRTMDSFRMDNSDLIVTRFNSDGVLDLAGFGN